MPSAEEFDSLIRDMPNSTKLIIFENPAVTWLSESFVGSYPRTMIGEELIVPRNATVWPTEGDNARFILHANFMNGDSNVTIDNVKVKSELNNITWVRYLNGKVPYFSGSGSFIEVPYSSVLNLNPPFTIETWVNYESVPGKDAYILDSSTEQGGYLFFIRDSKLWFVNGFKNDACTINLTVKEHVWNHLVVSYNGTHSVFYINGEKEFVKGPVYKPTNTEIPMWIGRSHWSYGGDIYYKGVIGVINIYNNSLSDQEVTSNYLKSFKPPYFKLDEKVSSPNGDAFLYKLFSSRSLKINSDNNIVVNNISWNILNQESPNPDLVLNLNVSSQKHCNITVILSSDAFSMVQQREVLPGNNNIDLNFKSFIYKGNSLSSFGSIIARNSNILVIDDQGNVILNNVTSIFQFSFLQRIGYGLLCIAIALLLLYFAIYCKGLDK
jgi:hypothetical protein